MSIVIEVRTNYSPRVYLLSNPLCFMCAGAARGETPSTDSPQLTLPGQHNGALNICYANAVNSGLANSPLADFLLAASDNCKRCIPGSCPLRIISDYFQQLRKPTIGGGVLPPPNILVDVLEPNLRSRLLRSGRCGAQHDPEEYLLCLLERVINEHCGYNGGLPYAEAYAGMRVFSDNLIELQQTVTATAMCGPCGANTVYKSTKLTYEGVLELAIGDVSSVQGALASFFSLPAGVNVECSD